MLASSGVPIDRVTVSAYRIPTDTPNESDGTLVWTATTLVVVEAQAGGVTGLGYTYADTATALLIHDVLADVVSGQDVMANGRIWATLVAQIRNLGRPGIAAMAIAAVDVALWDLKARLLEVPLVTLLGAVRDAVPVYGSGGFTSYSTEQLQKQLADWVQAGIPRVKMKIGRDPARDIERIAAARCAIGDAAELFVDANGAYTRKQALAQAERFAESGVSWYEEPVYHLDLEGLHLCRDRAPVQMEISVGEYGYDPTDFTRILEARAVDVLQADASRCEGITGLLVVDGLCEAQSVPLSTHCAPSLHAHPGCAAKRVRHIEYFHDHVRIEHMLFDGVLTPVDGALRPDLTRPGMGLEFKRADAKRFAI
jgi:L-alanine-DL-glutamate epimerase-like enolase superfamily enzyme